ncbi:MAG: 23S rRNA (pseudouridine(1915)-N(3))-methyltransferase RlmH [Saprospiraceae bacterium]|nr:23S rRNA (pseudouridine(1915)-N(3))-methyltransferase RlmH [Saprospiraceae bacterium]
MKIVLSMIGKTDFPYLAEGMEIYLKRLSHYTKMEMLVLPDIKTSKKESIEVLKTKEGELILSKLQDGDFLILLDEQGKSYTSKAFAQWVEQWMVQSHKRVVFQIGGAYGFSKEVYTRANAMLSLSAMTFSHQMVRLIMLEQLYRAMTIINREPYHHED